MLQSGSVTGGDYRVDTLTKKVCVVDLRNSVRVHTCRILFLKYAHSMCSAMRHHVACASFLANS